MMNTLGPFQVLEVVGRGGMGTVYRGLDPIIGRPVAIKVIRLIGYNDADERNWLRDRLFREARAAGNLCHPSIVTIYQVGEEMDVAYIAMEFVDGSTLQHIMDGEGGADKANLCRILWETANALDYAHQKGLVHRDVKPANIMVSASGATKVTDFGIAKSALSQSSTMTGQMLGTVFYMSPEQVRGEALDGRSDQFALAVIAYEIFTGRKPFQAELPTTICYQIIYQEPLSPDDINPAIGKQLAEVIKRGLSKTAAARYNSCAEFAAALTAALADVTRTAAQQKAVPSPSLPIPASPPLDVERHAAQKRKPYPLLLISVGAVFALLLPVLAVLVYRKLQPAPPTAPSAAAVAPAKVMPGDEPPPVAPPVGKLSTEASDSASAGPLPASQGENPPSTSTSPEKSNSSPPAVPEPDQPGNAVSPQPQQAPTIRPTPPPARGSLVWTGRVPRGTLVTVSGSSSSIGSLAGSLPGHPIRLQVYAAEESKTGLTVFTADPAYATAAIVATPRGPANFTFDPRHSTDVVVFEQPGPANNWERLVFQVNNPSLSSCVIEWKELRH